jgi:hypothetical protein
MFNNRTLYTVTLHIDKNELILLYVVNNHNWNIYIDKKACDKDIYLHYNKMKN